MKAYFFANPKRTLQIVSNFKASKTCETERMARPLKTEKTRLKIVRKDRKTIPRKSFFPPEDVLEYQDIFLPREFPRFGTQDSLKTILKLLRIVVSLTAAKQQNAPFHKARQRQ